MLVLLFTWLFSFPASGADGAKTKLTVYTYDSFQGVGTLGEAMQRSFASQTGIETEYVVFPTAGEALNQIALEGRATKADLLVGVDNSLLPRALALKAFAPLDKSLSGDLAPELLIDKSSCFLPFDFGFLAVLYDSRVIRLPKPITSWRDFAGEPAFARRLVIEDPRTSSLGLSLLFWTAALFPGPQFDEIWKKLDRQILTIAPGWSTAYGLFLKHEAQFVLSYTTSAAYHIEKEKTHSVQSLIFAQGHLRQIETVAAVAASPRLEAARLWIAHLLSADVQAKLPLTQWMYPARKATPLPKSFESLPKVKAIDLTVAEAEKFKQLVPRWIRMRAGIR